MSNDRMIPITNDRGNALLPEDESHEPLPGSVVIKGLHGTAFQRHFDDGLWHSTVVGHDPVTWEFLLAQRSLYLVYDADERVVATPRHGKRAKAGVL